MDEILKLVEDAPEVKEMDEVQVQQMTIKLQRCVDENLELRTKFPNEPRKFLDSEVALDETIQALQRSVQTACFVKSKRLTRVTFSA